VLYTVVALFAEAVKKIVSVLGQIIVVNGIY
jgi:hypothetical protein